MVYQSITSKKKSEFWTEASIKYMRHRLWFDFQACAL